MNSDEVTQADLESYEKLQFYHVISSFTLNKLETEIEAEKEKIQVDLDQ